MSTSWDEASKCPADGSTGRVVNRRREGRSQLVTLACTNTRCAYHEDGWVVQIRPDNTIPDPIDPNTREKRFAPTSMAHARRRMVLDALEEQIASETSPGGEVSNPYTV